MSSVSHSIGLDEITVLQIPEDLLLESSHSGSDLEDYLDVMFRDIVPGGKIIIGVADSILPDAKFDRVLRIGERIRKECRLPMQV